LRSVGLECAAGVVDGQGEAADLGVADGLFAAGVAGEAAAGEAGEGGVGERCTGESVSVSLPSRSSARSRLICAVLVTVRL